MNRTIHLLPPRPPVNPLPKLAPQRAFGCRVVKPTIYRSGSPITDASASAPISSATPHGRIAAGDPEIL
jgi:hypothetical protein